MSCFTQTRGSTIKATAASLEYPYSLQGLSQTYLSRRKHVLLDMCNNVKPNSSALNFLYFWVRFRTLLVTKVSTLPDPPQTRHGHYVECLSAPAVSIGGVPIDTVSASALSSPQPACAATPCTLEGVKGNGTLERNCTAP